MKRKRYDDVLEDEDELLSEDDDFELDDFEYKRPKYRESERRLERVRQSKYSTNSFYSSLEISKIKNEDMKCCYIELCVLMNMPQAADFLEPVDFIRLQLLDYLEVVTFPMDLGTVKKMILKNQFENPDHFLMHVELVFSNAQRYNESETLVYKNAEQLWKYFEEKYNTIFIPDTPVTVEPVMLSKEQEADITQLQKKCKKFKKRN